MRYEVLDRRDVEKTYFRVRRLDSRKEGRVARKNCDYFFSGRFAP